MFSKSIIWKLILPVPIALIIGLVAIWYFLPQQIAQNVRADAVRNGEQIANQFKVIRGYYTQNVIKKVKQTNALTPSFNHKDVESAVPLPATMVHDLSDLLKEEDTSVNLYSQYPFPNRDDRILDDFQSRAWVFLNANPEETFVRQELQNGQNVIRVAIADSMVAQACVDCHNSVASSPKTDWQLGDVRGVLEINTVIDAQLAAGATLSNSLLLAALIGGAILVTVSLIGARSVSRPITAMTGTMKHLADGRLEVEIPARQRKDEVGAMAAALQVFKENGAEMEQMRQAREQEASEAQQKLKDNMHALAAKLETSVKNAVSDIVHETDTMRDLAEEMSTSARSVSSDSTAVAAAAEEATSNVQTVASAAEEMASTIEEISRQVSESTSIASNAVDQAEHTNTTVQGLAEAAAKIGEVVNLISDIAEQTNLLALNATIEAARAGEAGKGFAVVASEVKNLASQTAKATEDIGQQIGNMQNVTQEAVTAIERIRGTIQKIDAIAADISKSVDEQGGATQEIARSVQDAAAGNQEVTQRINQVSGSAAQSGQLADNVRNVAANVAVNVNGLQQEVTKAIRQGLG